MIFCYVRVSIFQFFASLLFLALRTLRLLGKYATAGISAGTLLPLFPVCGFLLLKQPFKESKPPPLLVGVIVGSILAIFGHGYLMYALSFPFSLFLIF